MKAATVPDLDACEAALAQVLQSEEFAGAERLRSFLAYVVREHFAGRRSGIRAKTIAQDVYGATLSHGDDPLAVVRVDAGRLRRRLEAYYQNSGLTDPWRIHIDKGGYAPRFEAVEAVGDVHAKFEPAGNPGQSSRKVRLWLSVAAGVAIITIAGSLIWRSDFFRTAQNIQSPAEEVRTSAVRDALFSASPARLQAENLALEARQLMFPALDRQRLSAALTLFNQVIALDHGYFAGYAGAAQIYAIMAAITPRGPERDPLEAQARALATQAVDLAPEAAWSQSALAMAAFADQECDDAIALSKRAAEIGTDDLHVQNFDAIIALFCGDFIRARQVAQPHVDTSSEAKRLAFRNVVASAEFHLGNHQASVDAYNQAVRSGAPVGALTLAYLAAAYATLGDVEAASQNAALLAEAWPGLPVDALLYAIFPEPGHAEAILVPLNKAGWAPPSSE